MRTIQLLNKKNVKIFLKFVEIQTKIASVFPMVAGFLWSAYRYKQFNWLNSLIFVLAVLFFDMCTTAINNTMDYIKAKSERYVKEENVIGIYNLSLKNMVAIIFLLLGLAIVFSLILVFRTDTILLLFGAICFFIGIMYTYGPTPISRTPYGEFLSGFTMGFGIFFLAVFVQKPELLTTTNWQMPMVVLEWNFINTLEIFLMSLPFVALIANIMLANNIRDVETDIENERFTLISYIGQKNGVILYQILSILPWVFLVVFIIFDMLPIWSLIAFLGCVPHYKSLMRYRQNYLEKSAFAEAIKSFILFGSIYLILLAFACISLLF